MVLKGLGLGGGADIIPSAFRSNMLQDAASDDMRGRMQGVFIVVAGGLRIPVVLHGSVAEVTNTTVAAAGGGALVTVLVSVRALIFPTFERYRAERGDSDHPRTPVS
ncbi:hypothetical protein [Brevibacterium marinum]|uniref:Uncharacterized protein n=1 Tax=Brevibacterium marinum TaxID=418643 RepID=A0A846S1X2_9MICO|nr:hypothetical protein [Brevibacterium marinum]NJC57685.1 hypothetical protein [Brevibacterium marinum]